ncbi:MAG: glycoside hydrolase family 27 protein, partial [Treponema sp.]|nr:glycoside hydrolase family 27 protein [Treponema sp.]
ENLKPFGWEYVVIDAQWSDPNALSHIPESQYVHFSQFCLDEYARQIPAPVRFPSSAGGKGFRPLSDYVHSLGLKFGIHIMRGIPRFAAHNHLPILGEKKITADQIANPFSVSKWNGDMYGIDMTKEGAQDYYDSIFALYAEWGVDFVKVDDICNTNMYPHNPYSAEKEIEAIYKAIQKCGRKMVLSLSPGPAVIEKAWHLRKYANMWRITDDFWDEWRLLKAMFERCEVWQREVGEGCWPDCDMLPLGMIGKCFADERKTRFTFDEQRTMMTLWCIFKSPLMIGAELTKLDEETKRLLTNEEVLELLKNGTRAEQVRRNDNECVWKSCAVESGILRQSQNDTSESMTIALFNLSDEAREISVTTEELNLPLKEYKIRDLWEKRDFDGKAKGTLSCSVPAHGSVLLRIFGS